MMLLLWISFIGLVKSQNNCDMAPNDGVREICRQIQKWDEEARTVPTVSAANVRPPGLPPGISAGPAPLPNVPITVNQCMDLSCICDFFKGQGGNNCLLPNGQLMTKALRVEYRMMTDDQRMRYNTAMWTIKGSGAYNDLSRIHSQFTVSAGAHSGPAFLPWHREFIKRMEFALRGVDPLVTLPYWDTTLDARLPDPRDSVLFGNELMGKGDASDTVVTGAFRNWLIDDGSRAIRRQVGKRATLLQDSDIEAVMAATDYKQVLAFTAPQAGCPQPAGWTALEYSHGNPHVYIGGDMLLTTTSANDPIFFQLHAFIDFIWEMWRQLRQTRDERETLYPSDNSLCSNQAHFAESTMNPFFPMINTEGLSNKYTDNLYTYAPRPTCSNDVPNCGSKYLFCDFSHGNPQCVSKIVMGGNCSGFVRGEDSCYLGTCVMARCVPIVVPPTTTQPPIQTTTPVITPEQQETCFNENQCCSTWALRDECTLNPAYMGAWCRASCKKCRPNYDIQAECSNRHNKCRGWAATGECTKNILWMTENCRQACRKCDQTRQQICSEFYILTNLCWLALYELTNDIGSDMMR